MPKKDVTLVYNDNVLNSISIVSEKNERVGVKIHQEFNVKLDDTGIYYSSNNNYYDIALPRNRIEQDSDDIRKIDFEELKDLLKHSRKITADGKKIHKKEFNKILNDIENTYAHKDFALELGNVIDNLRAGLSHPTTATLSAEAPAKKSITLG